MFDIAFIPLLLTQVSFSRLVNVCSLSCQFYYTYETCKYCALAKKKAMYRYTDLTVGAYEEYLVISFFGWASLSDLNMSAFSRTRQLIIFEYDSFGSSLFVTRLLLLLFVPGELLRSFMFLGFEVVHNSNCSLVPTNDNYVFMAYAF